MSDEMSGTSEWGWLEALHNLRIPAHRSDVTAWHGHMPLAFYIVAAAKPSVFVELGTHKGDSYCAFCQAVEAAGLSTRCYAVDTWQGDTHAGHYDDSVYDGLRAYHDPRYGHFSSLLRETFDEALAYFDDGSIDLLHIDGLHTYEAVKTDFDKWLPKLSDRAVVLLHDVEVRERDFGVYRFWQELQTAYPTVTSSISNGLGIAAVGKQIPEALRPLFVHP
ncbi:MAG: class I SAM-dependent methyltransferase, partial [Firmicutes bacterium]|nr:class I SAM-dependent methyltransferase [Bacillota bacterium]